MDEQNISAEPTPPQITHRFIETNGLRMHIAEQGVGPLVVLLHGFPESWHSWKAQITALAKAGYHVVAPDQRGYGQTERPEASSAYTTLHLVGDIVGLLDALEEPQAIVIGHDWGSNVAWHAALLRPDRFRAVASLSVPYIPRGPLTGPRATLRPTAAMRQLVGDQFFYQLYFQTPGVAEAELEHDVRSSMRRMFYGLSGGTPLAERWHPILPDPQSTMLSSVPATTKLPPWLSAEDFELAVETFQRTGFHGGLNWYRAMDLSWELLAPFSKGPITQPALFMWGDQDPTLEISGMHKRIERMTEVVPQLQTRGIEGAGHWLQQEAAEVVTTALLTFLQGL